MALLENLKKTTERITGRQRPDAGQAANLVRRPKRGIFRFADDGRTPNHPRWPAVIYWSAVRLPHTLDPVAVMEDLFDSNRWGDSWRNGIYDYLHYHSRIHEVLGIARGSAKVQFGGPKGRVVSLKAGDVAILPAGTGHQCLKASGDLLVVGAYPPKGGYDECRSQQKDHRKAVTAIAKVARPRSDPVYGKDGPLLRAWLKINRGRT